MQVIWIIENIRQDSKEQEEALKNVKDPNTIRTTVENDDFDNFVNNLRTKIKRK